MQVLGAVLGQEVGVHTSVCPSSLRPPGAPGLAPVQRHSCGKRTRVPEELVEWVEKPDFSTLFGLRMQRNSLPPPFPINQITSDLFGAVIIILRKPASEYTA